MMDDIEAVSTGAQPHGSKTRPPRMRSSSSLGNMILEDHDNLESPSSAISSLLDSSEAVHTEVQPRGSTTRPLRKRSSSSLGNMILEDHENLKSPTNAISSLLDRNEAVRTEVQHDCPTARRSRMSHSNNLGSLIIEDHETLESPTSAVLFQNNETHIFTSGNTQFALERQGNSNVVKAKQFDEASPSLFLLHSAYTFMAVFYAGVLAIFGVQIILFLFLGLAIEAGLTSKQASFDFFLFFGTLFTIPSFLIGLSNAMAIAMAFVNDTWNDHKLMKTIIKWDSVLIDWISCAINFIIPLCTAGISLIAGFEDWWTNTIMAWFTCTFFFYLVFAVVTIFYEIDGCLELVRYHSELREFFPETTPKFSLEVIKKAVLMNLKAKYSGDIVVNYLSYGSMPRAVDRDFEAVKEKENFSSFTSIFSRITKALSDRGYLYDALYKPQRLYTVDEVRGYTPFVTNSSWGLEKVYFRNSKAAFVAIVGGKSAMTSGQAKSSFLCYFLALVASLIIVIAIFVWFDSSPVLISVVCVLYVGLVFQSARKALAAKHVYDDLVKKEDGEQSETLTRIRVRFRVSEARDKTCWVVLAFEILFLFLLPISSLFMAGNSPIGIFFIVVAIITACRRFLSAVVVLKEVGSTDGIEINNPMEDHDEEWREKHRLGHIVSEISSGTKRRFWISVYSIFILIFCALFLGAVVLGFDDGKAEGDILSSKHIYPGSGDLQYTSCQLGRGIATPAGTQNSLADFAFMSRFAYFNETVTNSSLATWFSNDTEVLVDAINHVTEVDLFRNATLKYAKSPVKYRLIGFPSRNVGIVAIRGTSNSWDLLTDAQLWSSAILAQWVRALLPLGTWLNPILPTLVKALSLIESSRLTEIAFYQQTTAFVEHLIEKGIYENIVVTGHSLGGGLAMITGAQTKTPSVALSGPNALISRLTFDPVISPEDLKRYTFNIVPDRDPVPRFDDLSQNYQRISCSAEANSPGGCHSAGLSLCEILYTCGSEGRPIPCSCVYDHHYPYPELISGDSSMNEMYFDEICKNKT